jgi:hypothetical protein
MFFAENPEEQVTEVTSFSQKKEMKQ